MDELYAAAMLLLVASAEIYYSLQQELVHSQSIIRSDVSKAQ